MLPIRCPQCGTVNHPDDIGFPLCGQCHTELVRCASCRHHDGHGCRHPRSRARYSTARDVARDCPDFRAKTAEGGPSLIQSLPAPMWVALILLLVLCLIGGSIWTLDPAQRALHGNPLRLQPAVPLQVAVGTPFLVTMHVSNPLRQRSTAFYIEVTGDVLAVADPGMPSPAPVRFTRLPDRVVFEYLALPADGQVLIQFPFVARQSGDIEFIAKVYAPANQLRHEVRAPIVFVDRVSRGMPARAAMPRIGSNAE